MQQQILRAKGMSYEIISHQKLCFVLCGCDAVFLYHSLYVFIHVHPLDRLLYLSLALQAADECICRVMTSLSRLEICMEVLHV